MLSYRNATVRVTCVMNNNNINNNNNKDQLLQTIKPRISTLLRLRLERMKCMHVDGLTFRYDIYFSEKG